MRVNKKRLTSSALLHVLFILLAVLSLIAAALLTIKLYSIPAKKSGHELFNRRSILEFIQYYRHFEVTDPSRSKRMNNVEWNGAIATVEEINWGTKKITTTTLSNELDTITIAFTGGAPLTENKALHILDRSNTLLHAGKAEAYGDVYATGRLKSSYIENKSPKSPFIKEGKVIQLKQAEAPKEIDPDIDFSDPTINGELFSKYKPSTHTYVNSFLQPVQVIRVESHPLQELDSLIGNFILTATDTLLIPSSIYLEHVLCYAPTIIVAKNSTHKGVELMSTKSTLIEEGSTLYYPTGLATTGVKSEIKIEKDVTIEGDIVTQVASKAAQQKNWPHVFIDEKAEISGVIFADGSLDMRGMVKGCVYCKQPIVFTKSGVYGNTILDGVINRNVLPAYWRSAIVKPTEEIAIVSWLE